MNNESKHDLAAAKKIWASLNATSAEKASDNEVYRLGQLIRESGEAELPIADPGLREQLISVLERMPDQNEFAAKDKPSKQPLAKRLTRGRWIKFSTAAALAVVVGGFLCIAVMVEFSHSNRKISRRDISETAAAKAVIRLEEAKLDSKREQLLSEERTARAMPLQPNEPEMQVANKLYAQTGSAISKNELDRRPKYSIQLVEETESERAAQISTLRAMFGGKIEVIDEVTGEAVAAPGSSSGQPKPPSTTNLAAQKARAEAIKNFMTNAARAQQAGQSQRRGSSRPGGGAVDPRGGIVRKADPNGTINLSLSTGVRQSDVDGRPAEFLSGGEVPIQVANGTVTDESWERKKLRRSKYSQIRIAGEKDRSLGTEQYDPIVENRFIAAVGEQALSTFSIDVDTASYSNMRRFINSGQRPPSNSVRIEELINYFRYDYPQPDDGKPFHVAMEVAECPWYSTHRLVRVGIKGKDVHRDERPAGNLVFLLDVSGSMNEPDKLPLLQRGLQMMVDRLGENDRVSIVTYAGNAGVRLEPTSGDQKIKIRNCIETLAAGGSTNGSAGIEMAYELAAKNFIKNGTNRVILATDGDLNVGVTDDQSLIKLIKGKASEGVFLTVLGFGTGNLKDSKMEKLADNGNGVYAYIDSMREARKVLVEQMSGSLVTIAKDVKLQVEFNPAQVRAYRLLGYENRKMANADFANDKKDAGEIGAGHTVTALYEIVPLGGIESQTLSANLKYQNTESKTETETPSDQKALSAAAKSGDLLTLAIRYKLPEANESTRVEYTLADSKKRFYEASEDFRFAAAVASFGMLLRNSQFSGDINLAKVERIASESIGEDTAGYRAEFVDMVRQFTGTTKE